MYWYESLDIFFSVEKVVTLLNVYPASNLCEENDGASSEKGRQPLTFLFSIVLQKSNIAFKVPRMDASHSIFNGCISFYFSI